MTTAARLALILLIFLPHRALAQTTPADFSGVDQFWTIADQLQAGIEPPARLWEALFATPGYAALEERERRRDALESGFRLALMPGLEGMRDSVLATDSWTARVIRHVRTLPSRRAELDALRSRLAEADILASSLATVQQLLPPGTVERLGGPSVAFLFFLPDGRGYPTIIVADLANISEKQDPQAFFAHEAMHFYYTHLAREHAEREGEDLGLRNPALLSLVTKLFEESLGDQFDKGSALTLTSEAFAATPMTDAWRAYMADYRREYAHAADQLRELNAVLAATVGDSARLNATADSLARELPLEGRPVGYFITHQIRRHLGDAKLAATVGSPAAWLNAYRAAAAVPDCGCPMLDEAWIARLP